MVNPFAVKFWEWKKDRSFHKVFSDPLFTAIDRDLKKAYFWKNPYSISREYCQAIGEKEIHQYGETPLTTMGKIARALQLKDGDHLYEYGSGRGRTAFFLRRFFDCQVTGIERNPIFVARAKEIAQKHSIDVNFIECDFLQIQPENATAIYLYGTCLPDKTIYELCEKFPLDVKIATITYPLCEYDRRFKITQKLKVEFAWGETEAYINQ